jgi:Uma2 family endonuclease
MATTKLWTIADVERLPDDGFRYELVRGELYRMPQPQGRHGLVVAAVVWFVYGFVRERDLGRVYDQSGVVLERGPDTLLGPDLSFIRRERLPADLDAWPEVAPDLVVEVVSPSQSGPSIERKVALYLAAGVRLVWVVDPERRTVHVYRADGTDLVLTEQDELDGEDVLPGFRLPVAQLFV